MDSQAFPARSIPLAVEAAAELDGPEGTAQPAL
jgi:hypothetical protein